MNTSEQISIRLHRTDLLFIRYAADRLAGLGIAPEQNLVVLLLAERSPQTQSELGAALEKDKTNMTRLLAALERKDLIQRTNPTGDRRSLIVRLTPAGQELARRTEPIAAQFQELLTERISESDLAVFTRTLATMNATLRASINQSEEH